MKNVLERLLNLLAYLLTVERPVTADDIRRTVSGYDRETDEAFHRMFERDKELLRRIGIPLELRAAGMWEIEQGYMVDPTRYRLPDPGLTDEERAALWLAAQVVRLGGQPPGQEAILKLGGVRMEGGVEPLAADLGLEADVLADLFQATTERRRIVFEYRDQHRRVAPYGLGHRRGHWYLVGDTGNGVRNYRVDRMTSVELESEAAAFVRPTGFRVREALDTQPWEAGSEQPVTAIVRFTSDVAWWAGRQLGGRGDADEKGRLVTELQVANRDAFIGWVLSFGDGVEVLGPEELRQAVVARVKEGMSV
jgi:proteasome accessory factor B